MEQIIQVKYEYTNNLYKAKQWLNNLPDLFAVDFEAASKYTFNQKVLLWNRYENTKDKFESIHLLQQINSNGLSHPSLTVITHLSVAWSNNESYIIICDNDRIRSFVYNFLTETTKTQIWHNPLFDFKHIYFHTNKLPNSYIDTMLLAKSLINNANSALDKVGLKDLMGYKYGSWTLAKDEEDKYTLENMWNLDMIKYTATDSCACMHLYEDIQHSLQQGKI